MSIVVITPLVDAPDWLWKQAHLKYPEEQVEWSSAHPQIKRHAFIDRYRGSAAHALPYDAGVQDTLAHYPARPTPENPWLSWGFEGALIPCDRYIGVAVWTKRRTIVRMSLTQGEDTRVVLLEWKARQLHKVMESLMASPERGLGGWLYVSYQAPAPTVIGPMETVVGVVHRLRRNWPHAWG